MPTPAAVRASASVLARLGMASTLDGADCGKVHVAHNVNVHMDDVVIRKSVATIANTAAPAAGRALVHPDGAYILDSLLSDNGCNSRWTLR